MRAITEIIIVASVVSLILWDIYAVIFGGAEATISSVVWEFSKNPALPFGVGFICGHWFWNSSDA